VKIPTDRGPIEPVRFPYLPGPIRIPYQADARALPRQILPLLFNLPDGTFDNIG
jgi:hypothetical protein